MNELFCPRCGERDLYRRRVEVEGERLSIAFRCATCADGLTLILANEWGARFEWSFTSEAEDALAELRAAEIGEGARDA